MHEVLVNFSREKLTVNFPVKWPRVTAANIAHSKRSFDVLHQIDTKTVCTYSERSWIYEKTMGACHLEEEIRLLWPLHNGKRFSEYTDQPDETVLTIKPSGIPSCSLKLSKDFKNYEKNRFRWNRYRFQSSGL